jgi:hypothetical protein
MEGKERCSFLKKDPKNFCLLSRALSNLSRDSIKKFFASFFKKRSACLTFPRSQ